MIKRILIFLVLAFSHMSCKKDCKLDPIPSKIFQLKNLKKHYLFHCNNEATIAKIIETSDYYEKKSFKGPMNVRECEHYKSYELEFKGDKISVSVRKTVPDSLDLDVLAFGNCIKFPSEKKILQKELLLNKYYTFERESNCDSNLSNSIIKKVILKGYVITSITTSDNKIWVIK